MTYEMANKPEFEDLATAIIHLTSETINRFTHIHQSVEDLIKKVQLLRAIAHETGSCFQRCVGWDALNATYMTTYDIDKKNGTDYHRRFVEYLKMIQSTGKMVVGGGDARQCQGQPFEGKAGRDDPSDRNWTVPKLCPSR